MTFRSPLTLLLLAYLCAPLLPTSALATPLPAPPDEAADMLLVARLDREGLPTRVRLPLFTTWLTACAQQLCARAEIDCDRHLLFNAPRRYYAVDRFPSTLLFLRPSDLQTLRDLLSIEHLKQRLAQPGQLRATLPGLAFLPLYERLQNQAMRLDPLGVLSFLQQALLERVASWRLNYTEDLPRSYSKRLSVLRFGIPDHERIHLASILASVGRAVPRPTEAIAQYLPALKLTPLPLEPDWHENRLALIALSLSAALLILLLAGVFRHFGKQWTSVFLACLTLPAMFVPWWIYAGENRTELFTGIITELGGSPRPLLLEFPVTELEEGLERSEALVPLLETWLREGTLVAYEAPHQILPSLRRQTNVLGLLRTFTIEPLKEKIEDLAERMEKTGGDILDLPLRLSLYVGVLESMITLRGPLEPPSPTEVTRYSALRAFFPEHGGQRYLAIRLFPPDEGVGRERLLQLVERLDK